MTTHQTSIPVRRWFLQWLRYLLIFTLPPLLIGTAVAAVRFLTLQVSQPPSFEQTLPAPPAYDANKRIAVIVAGNLGTENTDFLAPYEILAASDAFNVFVVAPERRPSPLTSMPSLSESVDIIPDFSIAEYEQAIGKDPDLIVIPFIPHADSPADQPILTWIREHANPNTTLLTICAGARTLALTGLLEGHQATSHHGVLPVVTREFPGTHWVDGVRYVDDGSIVSSSGVTGGIDATLYTLKKLVGADVAQAVATELNYPHARFLDNPAYDLPPANMWITGLNLGYVWNKDEIGVYLYDGVDELAIASIVDAYPFTAAARTLSVADERQILHTRHGLTLVPRWTFATTPRLDRILVPGGELTSHQVAGLTQWAQRQGSAVEYIHGNAPGQNSEASRQFVFDVTLSDVARRYSQPIAEVTVNGLEYPLPYAELGGTRWPSYALTTPLLMGLVSIGGMLWFQRRRTSRHALRIGTA